MSQLLMRWIPEELPEPELPEGFAFHRFRRGGDEVFTEDEFRKQWISMRDASFGETMVKWYHTVYDDPRVPDDGFFLVIAPDGRMASSACVQYGEHTPDSATVHAVCTDEKYRGMGLGRANMIALMRHVHEKGFPELWLTTDDWRIPAVRLYLRLGFLPVLSEPDMRGRWLALLDKTGERKIRVIGEDGQEDFLVKNG